MMGSILLLFSYVSAVIFLAAVVCRAVKIARLPIHVRWELYPGCPRERSGKLRRLVP